MNLYEHLEVLEDQISSQDPKQLFALLVLLVGGLIYGAYTFLIEPELSEIELKEAQIEKVKQKIVKNSSKALERKIAKLKKEKIELATAIDQLKRKKLDLMVKLQKENAYFFTKKSFSNFLDRMLQNSIKKEILIDTVWIKKVDEPFWGKLKVVREVEVNGSANFLKFVQFLRSVESDPLLLKVESVSIEQGEVLQDFGFVIKFYGALL